MSRVIQNANVTVRIKGLAVAYHNEETGNWEFVFLRGIPNHDLKIIVRKYIGDSNAPIEDVFSIPVDEKVIEIETTNPADHKPIYITRNFAQRVTADDSNDARWTIDLSEDLHKEPVNLERKRDDTKLTFLSISGGQFYTDTLSQRFYQMKKNGTELLPPRLNADWLGLDIEWSNRDSKTEIKAESMPNIELTPDDKVSIYEIEINNDCSNPQVGKSDFHFYYDHLVAMSDDFSEHVEGTDPPKDDCCPPKIGRLLNISSLRTLIEV